MILSSLPNQIEQIRGCKAGFLNSHAKLLLVVPASPEAVSKLKQVQFRQGDTVALATTDLSPIQIQLDGRRLPADSWFSSNRMVAVEAIEPIYTGSQS